MTDKPTFSNAEKAKEAEREVAMRRQVYGKRSGAEGMSATHKRAIAVMEAIRDDYLALAAKEELPLNLKGTVQ